ncbi:MAG TPA: 2-dehydropantoate 2-reductase [Kofleriaceae bacterium]
MNSKPRVLVMGAGGIGGIVAATLTEVGADVSAVTTNLAICAAVEKSGYRVLDGGEERAVKGAIGREPSGRYDLVVLATQPPSVEDAARTALPFLADDGEVVVLQNGLCEERVAAIVGAERVIGAIVAWGASMPEPGRYERTAHGGFALGRLRGGGGGGGGGKAGDPALRRVVELLEAIGPVSVTQNLRGARWSKLALNCAVSSLGTIAGDRLGPVVRVRRYRRLALEIMTEAVAIARAEGVALEKVSGTLDLDWIALSPVDRAASASVALTAKHALVLAVGLRYRRMRSSMLAAIERGRTPAIDFLNGEITARGAKHGIATPVNAAVVDAVWAIARGEQPSSRATLDATCAAAGV